MSRTGALAARTTDKELDKGRVDATRVKRYWAGKKPAWLEQEPQLQDLQLGDRDVVRTEVAAPVIVRKADPRLARLAASRAEDVEEVRERHREIRAAEVVGRRRHAEEEDEEAHERDRRRRSSSAGPGSSQGGEDSQEEGSEDEEPAHAARSRHQEEEEDEEELLRKRQAVRERLLQEQKAAEAQQQQQQEEESSEEEDETEYETDSEDEAYGRRLLKPVFVPKQARETIVERDKLEEEEQQAIENEKKRLQERKVETRQIVAHTIAAEEQAAKAAADEANRDAANVDDINTDDDEDQIGEYEAWKSRELARIKRFRDEVERLERAAAEREKLKSMTEDERRLWEIENAKAQPVKEKKKLKFMQKYWHKGAFFQEAPDDARGTTEKEEIFERDFSAPTGEDKFNKELLPKIMQVKNFGRSGRTKWTHLMAEDTTQLEEPLLQASNDRKRAGGSGYGEFAKPKKFKT